MLNYRNLPIARKIRMLVTLSTGIALLLASMIFVSVEYHISKQSLVQRISVMSKLIGTHVNAALTFEDTSTALRLLRSMAAEPDIQLAQIYTRKGELFASFQSPVWQQSIPSQQPYIHLNQTDSVGYEFSQQALHLTSAIELDGETIGHLYLRVSLQTLSTQVLYYLAGTSVVLLVLLLAIYLISSRLHQRISDPIRTLLKGMKTISEKQDYQLRIPQSDNDEIGSLITGFNEMIAEIEHKTQEVEQHAFYDALTGLANRRLLLRQLQQEVQRCARHQSAGALLYLDLDHFKYINDSLGHIAGDQLLASVAKRLSATIRRTDTAARVGGDEFVAIISDIPRCSIANNALAVAESIRTAICAPHMLDDRTLHTSPSIGITIFDEGNDNPHEIVKQADLAMYRAKEEGRNLLQFFEHDMQLIAEQRLEIEQDLRYALEKDLDQLELYYQPQMNSEHRILGAEALLRWHHPQKGSISPALFIPIAETTGLIHRLGQWLIDQACQQLCRWKALGYDIPLAINVSPNEFLHTSFVDHISNTLSKYQIDPSMLELEITEGVLLRNIDEAVRIMEALQQTGLQISIDDFGTGYSSLQYLKSLPIAKLKIDQSFVQDITLDANDAAIVTTIIAMTKHLGLKVIAEGVETREEMLFLHRSGCNLFQGFYFSRPLPREQLEQMLREQHPELQSKGKPQPG